MGTSRPPRMISAALPRRDAYSNTAQLENCPFIALTINPRRSTAPSSVLKGEIVWNQVVRHTCGKNTKITKIILDPVHLVLCFFCLLFCDDFPHLLNSRNGPALLQQQHKALPDSCLPLTRITHQKRLQSKSRVTLCIATGSSHTRCFFLSRASRAAAHSVHARIVRSCKNRR